VAGVVGCLASTASVTAAVAVEPVDIELVLAVDVSISVDASELALQRQGLAGAFREPAVIEAIRGNTQGVAVTIILWAGEGQQRTAVDWTKVTGAASAAALADTIDAALSPDAMLQGKTAIGDAMYFALRALETNGFDGIRRKIDVSGDGHANEGLRPERVRDHAVASGVTVNGLAIINDEPNLEEYYRAHVIGGANAFVMVAADYADFVEAIRRKLLQELSPAPSAALKPVPRLAAAR
jgi:hypothetical protein